MSVRSLLARAIRKKASIAYVVERLKVKRLKFQISISTVIIASRGKWACEMNKLPFVSFSSSIFYTTLRDIEISVKRRRIKLLEYFFSLFQLFEFLVRRSKRETLYRSLNVLRVLSHVLITWRGKRCRGERNENWRYVDLAMKPGIIALDEW